MMKMKSMSSISDKKKKAEELIEEREVFQNQNYPAATRQFTRDGLLEVKDEKNDKDT